jgi:hypothetical protein
MIAKDASANEIPSAQVGEQTTLPVLDLVMHDGQRARPQNTHDAVAST